MKLETIKKLENYGNNIAHLIRSYSQRKAEPNKTFEQEIRHTLSHIGNRGFMMKMTNNEIENILKSKEQCDYLVHNITMRLGY